MMKWVAAPLLAVFLLGLPWLGAAASGQPSEEKPIWVKAQPEAPVMEYEGQIKAVKVEKCGMQLGTCEGSLILATKGGGDVALAIEPGTWIKRGGKFVLIDELGVGNYITVQAVQLTDEARSRPAFVDLPPEFENGE